MYCHQCGKEIEDATFCPYCGAHLKPTEGQVPSYQQPIQSVKNDDAPNAGYAVLSFFIPIVGLVLYLLWNKEYPKKAGSCIKGFIASIVLYVVIFCCFMSFVFGIIARDDYDSGYDYYDYNSDLDYYDDYNYQEYNF